MWCFDDSQSELMVWECVRRWAHLVFLPASCNSGSSSATGKYGDWGYKWGRSLVSLLRVSLWKGISCCFFLSFCLDCAWVVPLAFPSWKVSPFFEGVVRVECRHFAARICGCECIASRQLGVTCCSCRHFPRGAVSAASSLNFEGLSNSAPQEDSRRSSPCIGALLKLLRELALERTETLLIILSPSSWWEEFQLFSMLSQSLWAVWVLDSSLPKESFMNGIARLSDWCTGWDR